MRNQSSPESLCRTRVFGNLASFVAAIVVALMATAASAQQPFKTPEEAADALVKAARVGDLKSLLSVLGEGGAEIVSSGDNVADAETRKKFVTAYDVKHQIAMEGNSKAILIIGSEEFPLPIPLVQKKGAWQFDTDAGRDEIIFRRIGRNELNTVQACLAYVDAQNEYASKDRGSGVGSYAQQFISDPGTKNGLYWPTAAGEEPSPLGELIARATGEGYRVGGGRTPYHGYNYRILTEQGAAAQGGSIDYRVKGKMIGGFALVAYPATYRNSGVMTFVVNHEGIVFEKDLGPNTTRIAERMSEFNPDKSWSKADTTPSPD